MKVSETSRASREELESLLQFIRQGYTLVVVGVAYDKWGETPLAVVERGDDHTVKADEMIAYTRTNLATYKCPSQVIFTD